MSLDFFDFHYWHVSGEKNITPKALATYNLKVNYVGFRGIY